MPEISHWQKIAFWHNTGTTNFLEKPGFCAFFQVYYNYMVYNTLKLKIEYLSVYYAFINN